jgi:hypothetical protein
VTTRARTAPADGAAAVIDLDARKAARMEKSGPRQVRFGGREWSFRPELPMKVVSDFAAGDLAGAFGRLLVEPEMADEFLSSGDLSQQDFKDLMSLVYGLDLGKF